MNHRVTRFLSGALILATAPAAHAELVTYDITQNTASTLESLGTKFVIGCTVLALGIAAAAFFSRRNRS